MPGTQAQPEEDQGKILPAGYLADTARVAVVATRGKPSAKIIAIPNA